MHLEEVHMMRGRKHAQSAHFVDFERQFLLRYRWVPAASGRGLRFEPVPNYLMAKSLRLCHPDISHSRRTKGEQIDREEREQLRDIKRRMVRLTTEAGLLRPDKPDKPTEMAGPTVTGDRVRVSGRGLKSRKLTRSPHVRTPSTPKPAGFGDTQPKGEAVEV